MYIALAGVVLLRTIICVILISNSVNRGTQEIKLILAVTLILN